MVNTLVGLDKLLKKKVVGKDGYILGDMEGLEVNTSNWQITHLRVKLSVLAAKEMGFKKRLRSSTVFVPVSYVSAIGDIVTIDRSAPDLRSSQDITEVKN
jgi:sporulation protein YlmC with PRC-barrel domain